MPLDSQNSLISSSAIVYPNLSFSLTGTLAAGAGVVAGVAYGAHNAIYPQGRDQHQY